MKNGNPDVQTSQHNKKLCNRFLTSLQMFSKEIEAVSSAKSIKYINRESTSASLAEAEAGANPKPTACGRSSGGGMSQVGGHFKILYISNSVVCGVEICNGSNVGLILHMENKTSEAST